MRGAQNWIDQEFTDDGPLQGNEFNIDPPETVEGSQMSIEMEASDDESVDWHFDSTRAHTNGTIESQEDFVDRDIDSEDIQEGLQGLDIRIIL